MKELKTSLLREKFTIRDLDTNGESPETVALSNRISFSCIDEFGDLQEKFVIRCHNMHMCVRMCARMVQSFKNNGPVLDRTVPFDWQKTWDAIVNDYEKEYNPQLWIAVYNESRVVFENGARHQLVDVIEKFDAGNSGDYEMSIPMAEDAFKKTGKKVNIDYDGNVALVVDFENQQGRCGVILRGADRTTTFTFTAEAKEKREFHYQQCLSATAAFLEGIQMAFMVGMNEEKIRLGLITQHSDEGQQTIIARKRLGVLNAEISNFESTCKVRFRPERPNFQHIIIDAEQVASQIFSSEAP